jgi:hypothetical protein
MKLFSEGNAHWYGPGGAPMHTVPSAKGDLKATTLREARKLGLLPSVTNVLGVIHRQQLVEWRMTQAVLAALTLPRKEGEPMDDFVKRVVEDAERQGKDAAAFGTSLHRGAERVAVSLEVDQADPVAPWLNHFRDWFQANCVRLVWCERVLVNLALGYAGTADLLIEHQAYGLTLLDLKSQHVKGKSGPTTYRTWGYQLAAYRAALGQKVTCMNLIMNSKEPHPPVEAPWSEASMELNWRGFQAARQLWVIEKGYDPCADGPGGGVAVPAGGAPVGPALKAVAAKEVGAA